MFGWLHKNYMGDGISKAYLFTYHSDNASRLITRLSELLLIVSYSSIRTVH